MFRLLTIAFIIYVVYINYGEASPYVTETKKEIYRGNHSGTDHIFQFYCRGKVSKLQRPEQVRDNSEKAK